MLASIALLAALVGCGTGDANSPQSREPIGLYTSLPILWRESDTLAGMLDADAPRHWALDALERHGVIVPLDSLETSDGSLPMPHGGLLVLAQPRPLAPGENVALDNWVRAGGRVLLFADPMLTAESGFALGDKRRPQDVVLLSPILSRWGLRLMFDEQQPAGERQERVLDVALPVNLPGRFELPQGSRDCTILGAGLAANCRVGDGRVLALADAAILEEAPEGAIAIRRAALGRLIAELESGDGTGQPADSQ